MVDHSNLKEKKLLGLSIQPTLANVSQRSLMSANVRLYVKNNERVRDKKGLSESMHCEQLYNEMHFGRLPQIN